jgi:hypothetical protein
MGTFAYHDPDKIRPLPGKCLVKIVEVLGGKTKGGLHIPEAYAGADNMGKDTFYGQIIKMGPPPTLEHFKSGPGPGWDVRDNRTGRQWPQEFMDSLFGVGDIVVFPRDVPLVFVWEEQRYCLCLIHEGIIAISAADFEASGFEVVPWEPPQPDEAAQG